MLDTRSSLVEQSRKLSARQQRERQHAGFLFYQAGRQTRSIVQKFSNHTLLPAVVYRALRVLQRGEKYTVTRRQCPLPVRFSLLPPPTRFFFSLFFFFWFFPCSFCRRHSTRRIFRLFRKLTRCTVASFTSGESLRGPAAYLEYERISTSDICIEAAYWSGGSPDEIPFSPLPIKEAVRTLEREAASLFGDECVFYTSTISHLIL